MTALFADSFYFFAVINPGDSAHARAMEFTRTFAGKMATTAWVLTEVADGMSAPGNRDTFVRFLDRLRGNPNLLIHAAEAALFDAGIDLYRHRPDKYWSLTDCISFVVMRRAGISEALTADHHFEQAGFQALLK